MIRFIDVTEDMWPRPPGCEQDMFEFCWYDTVIDKFVQLGEYQTWHSWPDFEEDYIEFGPWRENKIERFKSLFPKDKFGIPPFE